CPKIVSSEGGLSPAGFGCPGATPGELGAVSFPVEGDAWRAPGSMSWARANAGVKRAARSTTEGKSLNWNPARMQCRGTIALWTGSWHGCAIGQSKQGKLTGFP